MQDDRLPRAKHLAPLYGEISGSGPKKISATELNRLPPAARFL
jgi:hypothetical protein